MITDAPTTAYLLSSLLRAFRRANPKAKSTTLGEDIAVYLPRLSCASGSAVELVTKLCEMFGWRPTFDGGGPIQVYMEAGILPGKQLEDGGVQVPWTDVAGVLDITVIRGVSRTSAPFIASCAISASAPFSIFATITDQRHGEVRRLVAPADAIATQRYVAFGALESPLSHCGFDDRSGNVSHLRRELRYDLATGVASEIPMVSAAAIRGQLRRCAVDGLLAHLGLGHGDVEPGLCNALLTGGGLDAGAKGTAGVAAAHRVALRELCPLVDLFGGVFDNELMTGALLVYDLLPLAAETAAIVGEDPQGLPPVETLVVTRHGCRRPDMELDVDRDDRMIFGTEALAAGSTVFVQLALRGDGTSLRYATGASASWAVRRWQEIGAVGAREAQGYGAVRWSSFKTSADHELTELYDPDEFVRHLDRTSYKLVEWLRSGKTGAEGAPNTRTKKNKRAKEGRDHGE